ncbi:ArsC family reductase [Methylobacter sp. Wu1]|uniref:ArsC family reductase n=1 Tax=Methylobacter sp. Wu1 TaxID=3119359 RepID=UPI002F92A422
MYVLYGIKNCDTVKKARKWLDENNITYRFHDFRTDGLTSEQLAHFAAHVDWNKLLNRSSTSWRQLSAEQQADLTQDKALKLMLEMPTLIKRPVLDTGAQILVGFTARDGGYAANLSGTGAADAKDGGYAANLSGTGAADAKDGGYAASLPGTD